MFLVDGRVHFRVRGGGFGEAGFAHLPDGPPVPDADSASYTYSHLEDDWYTWER